jgi:hypothetical protein
MPVNPEEGSSAPQPLPQGQPADAPPTGVAAEVQPREDWLDWQENLRRGSGRRLAVDAFLITAYLVLTALVVMAVRWWWR